MSDFDYSSLDDLPAAVIPDRVAQSVATDLAQRAAVGLRKYGVQLADADLTSRETIQHAYEGALDLASYLKRVLMDTGEVRAAEIEAAREEGYRIALLETAMNLSEVALALRRETGGGPNQSAATLEDAAEVIMGRWREMSGESKAKEAR